MRPEQRQPLWACLENQLSAEPEHKRLKAALSDLKGTYPDLPINPSEYGMHSLRWGGVSAAWDAGVERSRIMAHGRWTSSAVDVYMSATLGVKLSVTSVM